MNRFILDKFSVKHFKFISLWYVVWLLVLMLIPVKSFMPNAYFSLVLNLSYCLVVLISTSCFYCVFCNFNLNSNTRLIVSVYVIKCNVLVFSILTLIGFLFIFYDRVFIRGLDYSVGLRVARYQWLSSQGGSFFSVVGNLIIPFGYVCLYMFILFKNKLPKAYNILLLLAVVFGIFGHAALNGGRSNVLVAIFVGVVIFCFGVTPGFKYKMDKSAKLKFLVVLSFLLFFAVGMSLQSVNVEGLNIKDTVSLGIDGLYGKVTGNYISYINDPLSVLIYIVSYLFHGSWTAESLYSIDNLPGYYFSYQLISIFNSIGLMDMPDKDMYFSDTGAFVSLPGSFYYDFGFFGVVFLTLILGALCAFSLRFMQYDLSPIRLAVGIYPLMYIWLAPILPAHGFVYFNFVIYAFLVFSFFNRFFFGKMIWRDS